LILKLRLFSVETADFLTHRHNLTAEFLLELLDVYWNINSSHLSRSLHESQSLSFDSPNISFVKALNKASCSCRCQAVNETSKWHSCVGIT